ncbi:unnamed protein product [Toxocara canis]|uniref:DUF2384 domain-containing protein n=1 Tax=Toxocara canis TaxID=6265 RepID=A0A183VAM1_TOXCA|nr:unnamed protein product [Toxocara canis]
MKLFYILVIGNEALNEWVNKIKIPVSKASAMKRNIMDSIGEIFGYSQWPLATGYTELLTWGNDKQKFGNVMRDSMLS